MTNPASASRIRVTMGRAPALRFLPPDDPHEDGLAVRPVEGPPDKHDEVRDDRLLADLRGTVVEAGILVRPDLDLPGRDRLVREPDPLQGEDPVVQADDGPLEDVRRLLGA